MGGTTLSVTQHKKTPPLMYFLVGVFFLFIGILVFVYKVTSKTHPVFVDEKGNPVNSQSSQPAPGSEHHP